VPAEAELRDFFDFEAWSIANLTSTQPGANEGTPLPALDVSAPQAACVLQPKRTNARRWAERTPPRAVELKVVLPSRDAWPSRHSARATVHWPFLPRFAAMDDSGKQLESGDLCATVTPSEHVATVWVWTGGQPIEANFDRQLADPRHGRLSLHVRSSPPGSTVPTPSMSVTVAWESPVEWPGMEEIPLILESRTSGQVERLRLRVQGAPQEAAGAAAEAAGVLGWLAWTLLARGLPLALLLGGCYRCCGQGLQTQRRVLPPQPPPAAVAGGLFGTQGVWRAPHGGERLGGPLGAEALNPDRGSVSSPFRRVDLRH